LKGAQAIIFLCVLLIFLSQIFHRLCVFCLFDLSINIAFLQKFFHWNTVSLHKTAKQQWFHTHGKIFFLAALFFSVVISTLSVF